MGMTAEQFWEQDCSLVTAYRKAYEIKLESQNYIAWLQGMYIYEALCDVSPVLHAYAKAGTKPRPYANKPYEFHVETKKNGKVSEETGRKLTEQGLAKMQAYAEMFNQTFQRKQEAKKKNAAPVQPD